jgi:hypothetical protein
MEVLCVLSEEGGEKLDMGGGTSSERGIGMRRRRRRRSGRARAREEKYGRRDEGQPRQAMHVCMAGIGTSHGHSHLLVGYVCHTSHARLLGSKNLGHYQASLLRPYNPVLI